MGPCRTPASIQFLKPPEIHRLVKQRDDVRVECLPVWIFQMILLAL